MRLHTYWRSSASFRVRIGLGLKHLGVESVFVHLRRGEQKSPTHLAVNPQGLVPVLEDGDTVIAQSLAILEYLDEIHPDPPLLPKAPADRAHVRSISYAIACEIQPLQNLGVTKALGESFDADADGQARWSREMIERGLEAIEELLARHPATGTCCFGDTPSLADLCLVPQIYNARRFGVDTACFPTLARVDAHCREMPAFAAAAPEAQPDAD